MPYPVGQARPLRWLVVAPFSVPVTGRFVSASGERFRTLMTRLGPWTNAEIPDGLGLPESRRSVKLEFSRPRDFRLVELVKQFVWQLRERRHVDDGRPVPGHGNAARFRP